jgi:hypothetical protein
MDIDEPTVNASKTEIFFPRCACCLIDIELPILKKSQIERLAPNRECVDRTETDEPSIRVSTMLIELRTALLPQPKTLKLLPARAKALTLIELPVLINPNTLRQSEHLAEARMLKELPILAA